MTMIRTRQALGSQIREALDSMVSDGRITSWNITNHATTDALLYQVHSAVTHSLGMTPGECMDWLNRHGFDIYIGKP